MKRRLWLIPIAAIVLWLAFKDIAYRNIVAGTDLPTEDAATYLGDDGWAVLPEATPPGAWNDPWGVDFFVVLPPSGAVAGPGLVGAGHEKTATEMTKTAKTIDAAISVAGPSYTAFYRHPSASTKHKDANWTVAETDIAMAFERYLSEKNNWRGVVLVTSPKTQGLTSSILKRIEEDPRLRERFGGVVQLQSRTKSTIGPINCSPAMERDCVVTGPVKIERNFLRWLRPSLRRSAVRFDILERDVLEKTLLDRNHQLSTWLDANAPKPAEPLGGFEDIEVIEIAPIRRPGETDENFVERKANED